jgi:RNA polymerase sigma-70 factor (family 1)
MPNFSSHTDEELTDLLKSDNHIAFTEIYQRYWKKMLLISWNHSRNEAVAQDIVHEVFMSLWERRGTVIIDNLGAFLATSIKFSIFKYYQKERRRTELAQKNYVFEDLSNEEDRLDALFLSEYINNIVEVMPEKCKLVFRYSRDMGMSNKEIAKQIAITEKGVEANITRALKIIRMQLKNYGLLLLLLLRACLSAFR